MLADRRPLDHTKRTLCTKNVMRYDVLIMLSQFPRYAATFSLMFPITVHYFIGHCSPQVGLGMRKKLRSFPHLWSPCSGFNLSLISNAIIYYPIKAIRIIFFSEPKSHSEPLFKSRNLLKLNDVIELHILSFVYQCSHRLLVVTPLFK